VNDRALEAAMRFDDPVRRLNVLRESPGVHHALPAPISKRCSRMADGQLDAGTGIALDLPIRFRALLERYDRVEHAVGA